MFVLVININIVIYNYRIDAYKHTDRLIDR